MEQLATVTRSAREERTALESTRRIRDTLRRTELFGCLDEADLAGLVAVCTLVPFTRRRQIYGEHEKPTAIFVIASGRARVVRSDGENRTLTVAYRGAREVVGETALLGGDTYKDAVTATDHGEAIRVPISYVRDLLQRPGFSTEMVKLMLERRLQAERRIESLLSRTVESRVAEFLMDAAERHGIPESRGTLIGVKYTHQEIADYVGSTRETVTLTLGDLRRRDLILFDHRRVVVVDPAALRRLV